MSDVVVVGGGIVGCACAYELAKAGARVTLLEYGKTGMQATNAAAGMLAPLIESPGPGPMLQFGLRALRDYPAVVEEVQARCGFDAELRLHGILKVAFTDDQLDELRRRFAWQRELGFPLEWLDGDLCREMEPRLSPAVAGGVFSPGEGGVNNQLLALGLERATEALGATLHDRTPVTGFTTRGGRVAAVRSGEQSFPCDTVVLAAGARSGQIARKLHAPLPVEPVRGQMIAFGGMRPPVQRIVWGPDGYLVPRANGLVFAGATVERVGFRRRTTKQGLRHLRTMAEHLVPQFAAATQHFDWAGLRPGTPDNLPIIGTLRGWSNVTAATGHYRNGILLGPLTGRVVADGITRTDWRGVPQEFSPVRFLMRGLSQ
jgi:glycine oxidase